MTQANTRATGDHPQGLSRTLSLALCLLVGLPLANGGTLQLTVLAKDGLPLADAVVTLDMPGIAPPALSNPASNVTISQQKMQFSPMVSLIMVGSKVKFANLDSWDHHVRGLPMGLIGTHTPAGFELRLPGKVADKEPTSTEVTFDKPGLHQLSCHLHGSMRGFIVVTDAPWAAKTDSTGVLTLRDVPEGAARLRLWHPDQLLEMPPTVLQINALTATTLQTAIQPRRRRS